MRFRYLIYIFIITFFATLPLSALGTRPTVHAELDTVNILMGKQTRLKVTVTQDKGDKGYFPLFRQVNPSGVIGVCGDSVEYRTPVSIDTIDNGGRITIKCEIPVQAFDSGYYRLPELEYVVGNDTARTGRPALKVVPVKATAEDPIADYAGVADPADSSIFDFIPDWVIDYWWLILIIALAIVATLYGMKRYRKEGSLLPRKPEPTPYEIAIKSLRELKEKKLWEQGLEKEYFTELTEILRVYLYGRFGINAMEMTSRQILTSLSKNAEAKEQRHNVRQILDMADFVKFAKVRPLPEDNIASYDNAVKFVEETRPINPEPEGDADKEDKAEKADKGNPRQKGGKK